MGGRWRGGGEEEHSSAVPVVCITFENRDFQYSRSLGVYLHIKEKSRPLCILLLMDVSPSAL